jgi:hypothetical protein
MARDSIRATNALSFAVARPIDGYIKSGADQLVINFIDGSEWPSRARESRSGLRDEIVIARLVCCERSTGDYGRRNREDRDFHLRGHDHCSFEKAPLSPPLWFVAWTDQSPAYVNSLTRIQFC